MLTKQFILTHANGVIQVRDYENTGKCNVGKGFTGVEFDTSEELDAYVAEHNLITIEEAIETKVAVLNGEIADTATYVFDAILFDSVEEAEQFISDNELN